MLKKVLTLFVILFAAPARPAAAGAPDSALAQARAFHQKGDFAQARAAYQRTLAAATVRRDDLLRAGSLLGLAQIDLSQGRYGDCIKDGTLALALFRAVARQSATLRNEEAKTLTSLGQARFYSGDSEAALTDFESGLDIARETGDREAEITRLNNIGNVYYSLGRYGEAFQRYQVAEDRVRAARGEAWIASRAQLTAANQAVLYQRVGQYGRALRIYSAMGSDPRALPGNEQAQMLANMGTLYRRLGDPVTALEKYRAAQSLYHRTALVAGETGVLNNIGIAQAMDLRQPSAALASFNEALRMAEKSGSKRLVMTSLLYRGEALLRAGRPKEAALDFNVSSVMAGGLNADEENWKAAYGLARAADAAGDVARSGDLLRRSIGTIERMRKNSALTSGRTGFLIDRRDVYDLLIDHESSRSPPDIGAILQLMEKSRARDLQDRLGRAVAGLDEMRRRLPKDTLLLEYWLGDRSLAIIGISNREPQLVYRQLSDSEMSALLDLPHILTDAKRADWREKARFCSGLLLDGIRELRRPGIRRLIVVPDGDLARIPFGALPADSDGTSLLIDRVAISYLPFASAFRNTEASRPWLAPWKRVMTGFANPLRGVAGQGLEMGAEERQKLPDAAREVKNAASAIGGRADLYFGREARKRRLTEGRGGLSPVLHFATHAFADPDDPERSYILFSGEKEGFDYLFLKEAAGLDAARGSLVTVSACDSGAGRLARGEGVQSFGSAFLAAGAKAVVTSLWRVGDRPAAELMSRFYEGLANGDGAADALRNAGLAFRRSPGAAAHPAYWAGFVLTGDGDMRIPGVVSWRFVAALAALAGCLAAVFAVMRFRKRAGRV